MLEPTTLDCRVKPGNDEQGEHFIKPHIANVPNAIALLASFHHLQNLLLSGFLGPAMENARALAIRGARNSGRTA